MIPWFCLFWLLLECGVVLAPLLRTGYFSDDLINSLENAKAHFMGWNAGQYYLHRLHSIIVDTQRLNPFIGSVIIPYLLPGLMLYKWMVIACVTGNIVFFAYYLNSVLKSRSFGFFAASFIPLLLQFRLYHDPVLSFYLSQQLMAFFMLFTLFFLDRYVATKQWFYLLGSLIAFNMFLYSYEVGYIFLMVIMGEIWLAGREATVRRKLLLLMPYGLSCLAGAILLAFIRIAAGPAAQSGYEGIQFNFAPLLICKTFAYQVFSAFPLSYHLGGQGVVFSHAILSWAGNITSADMMALVAFGFLYWVGVRRNNLPARRFLVLGAGMVIFPAILIAMSQKYQLEIPARGLGVGYFVVYLQYFGTALLLGTGIALINHVRARYVRGLIHTAIFAAFCAILLVVLQDNRFVIAKANAALTYRRIYLEQALHEGVLAPVPSDAWVLLKDDYEYNPYGFITDYDGWAHGYPWRNEYFVFQWTGKKIRTFQKIRPFMAATECRKYLLLMSNSPSEKQPEGAFVSLYSVNRAREHDSTVTLDLTRQTRWDSGTRQTEPVPGQAILAVNLLREK